MPANTYTAASCARSSHSAPAGQWPHSVRDSRQASTDSERCIGRNTISRLTSAAQ